MPPIPQVLETVQQVARNRLSYLGYRHLPVPTTSGLHGLRQTGNAARQGSSSSCMSVGPSMAAGRETNAMTLAADASF